MTVREAGRSFGRRLPERGLAFDGSIPGVRRASARLFRASILSRSASDAPASHERQRPTSPWTAVPGHRFGFFVCFRDELKAVSYRRTRNSQTQSGNGSPHSQPLDIPASWRTRLVTPVSKRGDVPIQWGRLIPPGIADPLESSGFLLLLYWQHRQQGLAFLL